MRAADRGCQILARFFVDNILYVSFPDGQSHNSTHTVVLPSAALADGEVAQSIC